MAYKKEQESHSKEEEATKRLEEEQLNKEIQEEFEEEDTIQRMDDEPGTPEEPSLIGGYLPFGETRIIPPPTDRVMDVCSVKFDQQKKRIMEQRRRYFPNDP